METLQATRGKSLPLGATMTPEGVNFALLCRHGTAVSLVIFDLDGIDQLAEITLHPQRNRTGDHWHVHVRGLTESFSYGWRVDGPVGGHHRYNRDVILLDPMATAFTGTGLWGTTEEPHKEFTSKRSAFVRRPYAWGEDVPPLTPLEDSIIYEVHVRGFTCSPTSFVAYPGTFLGLIEKIPYLVQLGITAVELLPIHEFDEIDCPFFNPFTGDPLRNFWGYNSIGFAAPKAAYAASGPKHNQVNEFREMVRAFHDAGIEVYLDVVFYF